MYLSYLFATLPLVSGSALLHPSTRHRLNQRQLYLNYTAPSSDSYPGGRFGLINQVSVISTFIGVAGIKGDIPAAVSDLEFTFPSLKSSGYSATVEKTLRGGIDGLIDTLVPIISNLTSSPGAAASGVMGGAAGAGLPLDADTIGAVVGVIQAASADLEGFVCKNFQDPNNLYVGFLGGVVGEPSKTMAPDACEKDTLGGSGPYRANWTTDYTLPDHTIYVPKTKTAANVSLPVIVWGNAGCVAYGAMFSNLLTEIASHGYMVIATGNPKGVAEMTRASDLTRAIDWATSSAAQKYGNIDASRVAAAGQSCGGMEALSASYNDSRVKTTALFNSGVFEKANVPLLQDLKAPIAYFMGGPPDFAYPLAERDYATLKIPALKANLQSVGTLGTFYQKNGGIVGQAALAYFNWRLKDNVESKSLFCSPAPNSTLVKTGWAITSKNGMC